MADQKVQIEQIETIILRFRDLVTGPGGTVQQHDSIAADKGSVWWGWWNKLGEQVPLATFDRLKGILAKNKKLDILLLDSGQNKIYATTCLDIEWKGGRVAMESPDRSSTPAYYQTEKYLAWFKLGRITEVIDTSRLSGLSCVRVDEFFSDDQSNYDEFYNKKIYSPAELTQQNRTIWFVRNARPNDPSHFVRLLDANRIVPGDFPARVLVSDRDRFLWVSDLHFGPHHGFPPRTNDSKRDLWNALEEATKSGPQIAGLLITGDLTWRASRDEFDEFGAFMRNALSTTRWENNYYVVLCPGNHDFTFSTANPSCGSDPGRATPASTSEYERAYDAIFYKKPNEYFCSGRKFVLKEGLPVEIVALNSSLLQQTPTLFQGHGFIGQLQLEYVAKQMRWTSGEKSPNGALRILMLHHHLLPVTYRENAKVDERGSIVFDANAVMEWIANYRVDLVLHGHQHQPFCARLSYPIRQNGNVNGEIEDWHEFHVLGLGSTGVDISDLGETKTNTYAVLIFDHRGLTVSVRPVSPGKTMSATDELWSVNIPRK